MLDRVTSYGRVGVAERPELVGEALPRLVLEGVRVDRVEADAKRRSLLAHCSRIARLVPRDVKRDARRGASEPVDHGGVLELLRKGARLARPREAAEARAAGAERP